MSSTRQGCSCTGQLITESQKILVMIERPIEVTKYKGCSKMTSRDALVMHNSETTTAKDRGVLEGAAVIHVVSRP